MRYGTEHDYLPPHDSNPSDDDGDFIPTIDDDGHGVGD